mmetsp:Transcript_36383/g.89538  ORF Transcript_36383/g.89538 Transcript_36383/m.89538 type:complete len:483 (-) Transcript_36383:244-1692(-)|eukprot:CAMPEP_0206240192 /NCGR_PEP_ID=MMETSP0047_2-20121206/15805_1 /ASSEMBLY_ACC=CAM_ASM_000192 /TAXON_ID=195065 /ORGANISM="Chroomonas mesostigmatica_cf, Strain CCMP1168" /LENGTH=482 /DNA_ID=CAMNT_0053664953 /DNA_START=119 /DNA_END=1567 /DNA_ORIENTATION=+
MRAHLVLQALVPVLAFLAASVDAAPVVPSGCACQFTISAEGLLSRGGAGCDPTTCTGEIVLTGKAAPGTSETGSTTGGVIKALDAAVFQGLISVESIDLRSNQLSALPEDAFSGMKSLKTLKLSFNKLTKLPARVFDSNAALRSLFIDHNELGSEALPDLVFQNNANLRFVHLNNNRIPSLPLGVFEHLVDKSALGEQVVDLRSQLGVSGANVLQCYPPLSQTSLLLGGMKRYYRDTSVDVCKGVAKCKTTEANKAQACMFFVDNTGYLSRGKDYGAGSQACKPEVCVGSLDFSKLGVPKISKFTSAFRGLVNVEFLYFGAQNLAGGFPEPKPFQDMRNVKHLDLQGTFGANAAGVVPHEDLLWGLTNLEWLDLSNNALTAIPARLFCHSIVLTTLNLRGNKLVTMPEAWLKDNAGLVELFMADNTLASLPANSFEKIPNLALSVEGNDNLVCIPSAPGLKLISRMRTPTTSLKSFCQAGVV